MKPIRELKAKPWYLNLLNAVVRVARFLIILALAFLVYTTLLSEILVNYANVVAYVLLWLFSAYIIMPPVTRALTKLYVPDYFIGRARTNDGLLGDPINLAFNGAKRDVIQCFEESGWTQAEPLSFISSVKIVYASVFKRSYAGAPVSSLFLFNQKQDLAFEKQIEGNPRRRHHVRLWKTPRGWHLPGGRQADWLGAATYDKNVGLSLFTGQITHKIDANIDKERDFVLRSLKSSALLEDVTMVKHFTAGYHSRNGGGDLIHTDGTLPFVTIVKSP